MLKLPPNSIWDSPNNSESHIFLYNIHLFWEIFVIPNIFALFYSIRFRFSYNFFRYVVNLYDKMCCIIQIQLQESDFTKISFIEF